MPSVNKTVRDAEVLNTADLGALVASKTTEIEKETTVDAASVAQAVGVEVETEEDAQAVAELEALAEATIDGMIEWAVDNGLLDDVDVFDLQDAITGAQLQVIMTNYLKYLAAK